MSLRFLATRDKPSAGTTNTLIKTTVVSNLEKLPIRRAFKVYSWCGLVDVFQTSVIQGVNDQKLINLVDLFGLSGELLGQT